MPTPTPTRTQPRLSVGFILANRFTLSAFACFVDVLRLAADEGDRSRPIRCGWRVISPTLDPVVSSCGAPIRPDERLGDPARFDYIAVVGGLIDEIPNLHPDYIAFLRRAAAAGTPLIGLCTGAFVLHRAGLMEGRRTCVSWFHREDFLEQFDGLEPAADRIFVVDGDRITCSGGASSAHLAAYLVERRLGPAPARKSLRIMIIDEALAPETTQPGAPAALSSKDPLVRAALLAMQAEMASPRSVAEIAARLGVTRRRLERRFRAALDLSPGEADKRLRLAEAERLLRETALSVSQIAQETGFYDASHFIKAFRERRGETPEVWRVDQPADQAT